MLSALSFLTVVGTGRAPSARTIGWFPLAGAAIGAVQAGVLLGADAWWDRPVSAALVVVADLALTGALHQDGLADSADGLLPHLPRERRLEVMRQSDVGAFALAVVPAVMLARWAALAAPDVEALHLVGVAAASRTLIAVIPALVPYARASGLASTMHDGARRWMVAWLVPAAAVLGLAGGPPDALVPVAGVAVAWATCTLAVRRLGGYTGDVLGAVVVLAEASMLLAVAA